MNGTPVSTLLFRACLSSAALALVLLPRGAPAQTMDHSKMQMPAPEPAPAKPPVRKRTAEKPAAKPVSIRASAEQVEAAQPLPAAKAQDPAPAPQPAPVDHSAMHMDTPPPDADTQEESKPGQSGADASMQGMDHSAMDMDASTPVDDPQAGSKAGADSSMRGMDHSGMEMGAKPGEPAQLMDHSNMPGMSAAPTEPVTPIPELTEADRADAIPPPGGHTVHDNSIHSFVLLDRLEVWNADEGVGAGWEALGWIGTDLDRMWLRSEGERIDGTTESGDAEVFYGRNIARWWDAVVGVRQDFGEGPSQTFAAFGVIGLAPYKFEVEATAYVGEGGQTAARVEAEYDTLFTNRLILQSQVEANLYGKDDPQRGIGSGISTLEVGLRLRYEIRREFAPYIGVVWERAWGNTADIRRERFGDINDTRIVAGVRIWF